MARAATPCLVTGLDGVLCASAEEASVAACRAAYKIWPDVMAKAESLSLNEAGVRQSWVEYDWQQLLTHPSSLDAPPWLLYKVQQLRCACAAEWELVLFARLCVEEALSCRANEARARPLTVGEIESNAENLRDLLMARWAPEVGALQSAMAEARKHLDKSEFFGEVLELIWRQVANGSVEESVHVITSRDAISAVRSLQMSGQSWELPMDPPDYQGTWQGKDGWRLHAGLSTVSEKLSIVQSLAQARGSDAWLRIRGY